MNKNKSASLHINDILNQTETRNIILEELPVGLCLTDLAGAVEYVNQRFGKITGYKKKDILGKNMFKMGLFHDDIAGIIRHRIAARSDGGTAQKWDAQLKRRDGSWIWVFAEGVLIRKKDLPVGYQIAINDITDRKRAEEKIRYQAGLLENVSDAVISSDKEGFIQSWNRAAERIYGWKANELAGKNFHDILKPEYRYHSREEVVRKLKTEGVWSGEIIHHRKDGQVLAMISTISVLKDIAGNQTGFVSVNHDITAQKQAEEALKESEEKYRLMVESSRDAIVISQNDRFVFINDAFAEMLGYDRDKLIRRNYRDVYTEEAIQALAERERQRSKGAAVLNRYETTFRKNDGSEIPVEANIKIIDYHGQKATFAVIRDITKQKEILKTLEEAARRSINMEGFIPICAGCNKIRDEEKEGHPWVDPYEYFAPRHPDLKFSHGMCPECMQKWYPKYARKK